MSSSSSSSSSKPKSAILVHVTTVNDDYLDNNNNNNQSENEKSPKRHCIGKKMTNVTEELTLAHVAWLIKQLATEATLLEGMYICCNDGDDGKACEQCKHRAEVIHDNVDQLQEIGQSFVDFPAKECEKVQEYWRIRNHHTKRVLSELEQAEESE